MRKLHYSRLHGKTYPSSGTANSDPFAPFGGGISNTNTAYLTML